MNDKQRAPYATPGPTASDLIARADAERAALARRPVAPDLVPAGPVPLRSLQEVIELGGLLAKTGFFKDVRDAGQAVAKILYGAELGIGPMGSMMGVHIIEGKPSPSANLMATLIKRSGRYNYRVTTWTDQACVIEFTEHGQPCGTASFTMQEAARAEVATKVIWKKYPKAMLFSRAISQGARAFCADVFGGAPVYTAEELGAAVDYDAATGEIVPTAPTAPQSSAAQTPASEPVNAATGEIAGEFTDVPAAAPPATDADAQFKALAGAAFVRDACYARLAAVWPALGMADNKELAAEIHKRHPQYTVKTLPLALLEQECEFWEKQAELVQVAI